MDAQLKKGVLELCMLASVAKEEQYGYDVIRKLRAYFPEVEDSAFYVILRRLHREGSLEQYAGTESGGPSRKYYRITQQGRESMLQLYADWQQLTDTVETLMGQLCL